MLAMLLAVLAVLVTTKGERETGELAVAGMDMCR
jgi:hypothetical protein